MKFPPALFILAFLGSCTTKPGDTDISLTDTTAVDSTAIAAVTVGDGPYVVEADYPLAA